MFINHKYREKTYKTKFFTYSSRSKLTLGLGLRSEERNIDRFGALFGQALGKPCGGISQDGLEYVPVKPVVH